MCARILYTCLTIIVVTVGRSTTFADFLPFRQKVLISKCKQHLVQNFNVFEGSTTGTLVGNVHFENQGSQAASFLIKEAEFLGVSNYPKGDSTEDPEYNASQVIAVDSNSGQLTVLRSKYLLAVLSPLAITLEVTDTDGNQTEIPILITIEDREVTIEKTFQMNWERITDHPNSLFEGTGGFVNATFYTFGGFTPSFAPRPDVHGYNLVTKTWIRYKDMPPMAVNSGSGGATHMGWTHDGNHTIYIAAGFAANATGTGQQFGSKRVYRYNIFTDNYSELPALPIDRSAGNLHFYKRQLFYVAGTNKPRDLDQGDVLVLHLDSLSQGWQYRSPMPNPRHHSGSVLLNGKLFIVGGQKEHDDKLVPQDDVHCYDIATDTWTYQTDMPQPFNHIHASTFTYKDYIFTVGGQIEHNKGGFKQVFAYHPKTDTWIQFTDLPEARYAGVADIYDNQIYYTGGNFSKNTYVARLPLEFTEQFLSISRTDIFKSVLLFPNPVDEILYIRTKHLWNTAIKRVAIFDTKGKNMLLTEYNDKKYGSDIAIPLENLEAGMYILKLTNRSEQTYFSKFLKK